MKVKRNFISGILIMIVTIVSTTDGVANKGGGPSKFSKAKTSVMNFLNMSTKTFQNWKANPFSRNLNKAVKFAPVVKEERIAELLELIANEADLIKIGAYKKLNNLSRSATTEESKKALILAKLQATIELVKLYGVKYNSVKAQWTLAQGMYYAHSCKKLYGESNQADCLRKKIQLFTAYIFSHKLDVNRFMRIFLKKMSAEADKYLPGDRMIKFINTRIACEVKFAQDTRNIFLKAALKMYMGASNKAQNYNCVNQLLEFEDEIAEVGSYPGEFHYLLARAYGHQKNYLKALEHLCKARKGNVVDSKTRETNKKVQAYYEKIYTRLDATGAFNK